MAFIHSVGSDEQFYVVKNAAVLILACLLLAATLLRSALHPAGAPAAKPHIVTVLFAAWLLVSVLIAANKEDAVRVFAYLASLLVIYHLATAFPDRILLRKAVMSGTGAGAAVVSVFGLLEFANRAPSLFLDWGDRAASLFSDPNFFGIFLVIPLMAAAGGLLFGSHTRPIRLTLAIFCVVCFAALIVSNSRSAWISLLAGIVFFFVASMISSPLPPGRRLRSAAALPALLAVLVLAGAAVSSAPGVKSLGFNLPGRVASIPAFLRGEADARLFLWKSARDMAVDRPVQGFGLGSFPREYHPYQLRMRGNSSWPPDVIKHSMHAYNDYLELASETGLIGAVLWLAVLFMAFGRALRGATGSPAAVAACAGCFAYFADGVLFQYPLYNSAAAVMAFAWLGALHEPRILTDKLPGAAPPAKKSSPSPVKLAGAAAAAIVLLSVAFMWAPLEARSFAMFNRAGELMAKGKVRQALILTEKAMTLQPRKPFYMYLAARAHLALALDDPEKHISEAQRLLRASIRLFPYNSDSHLLLAEAYTAGGRPDRALKELDFAEKYEYGDRTEIKLEKAATLMADQRYNEAVLYLNKLISKDEEYYLKEEAWARRELTPHIGDYGLEYSELTPEQITRARAFAAARENLAQELALKGKCLLLMSEPKSAIQQLIKAVRLEPRSSSYFHLLGTACALAGDYKCATEALSRTIELDPENASARKALESISTLVGRETAPR